MDTNATTKAATIQANTMYHTIGCFNQAINATKDSGHSTSDRTITTAAVGSLSNPGQDLITWVITDTKNAITPMASNKYERYCIISDRFILLPLFLSAILTSYSILLFMCFLVHMFLDFLCCFGYRSITF